MGTIWTSPELQVQLLTTMLPKALQVALIGIFSSPFWPLTWLGTMRYGRPPNMVHLSQVSRYLRYVWTELASEKPLARPWLTLSILQRAFVSRLLGTAWLLDEVLYGRGLDGLALDDPLFVISGGRSGSTQIARYLEDDPRLLAPSILMCMFPYLWLWKLIPVTVGRFLTKDRVREMIAELMPKEAIERHELDPFKADTFDGAFLTCHLNGSSLQLGPEVAQQEFSFAEYAPHNKALMEVDFCDYVDRIGRKTLLYHGGTAAATTGTEDVYRPRPRFFIKGHFLLAAPALSRRYPRANFLTVVREPLSRLQSGINYLRVNPADPFLGPVPWEWLAETLTETESRYCEVEMEWFASKTNDDDDDRSNRCAVRFIDFATDLTGTMTKVYRECCGARLPEHIPDQHPPRDRNNYSVNRTLDELGVDRDALRKRLAEYIEWSSSDKVQIKLIGGGME